MEEVKTTNEVVVSIYKIGMTDNHYADAQAMTLTRDEKGEILDGCGGGDAKVFDSLEDATRWAIEWIDKNKQDGHETAIHYSNGQVIDQDDYEKLLRRPETKSPFE